MSRELSVQGFALAIAIVVSARRTRMHRRERLKTAYVDNCIELLREGPLSPTLIRYRPGGIDPTEAERRRLCAETLAYFEAIAPIVRAIDGLR